MKIETFHVGVDTGLVPAEVAGVGVAGIALRAVMDLAQVDLLLVGPQVGLRQRLNVDR